MRVRVLDYGYRIHAERLYLYSILLELGWRLVGAKHDIWRIESKVVELGVWREIGFTCWR